LVVLGRLTASEMLIRITGAMNYDKTEIPATYDKARALSPETRRLWYDLLSVHVDRAEISLIIDLGCGTGRFSELLAAHFGVQVIGIDPSLKMLDQARGKPAIGNVVYCQGLAEAVPFRDGCADFVFMSMVYDHFCDPSAVAKECHRVLRRGGYASIRNGTSHCGNSSIPTFRGSSSTSRARNGRTPKSRRCNQTGRCGYRGDRLVRVYPRWMKKPRPSRQFRFCRGPLRSRYTAITQGEAEIQPDGVLDDRGREAMAAVAERSHADILSDTPLAPVPVSVTMPI
jgi:SAM-dependent methyltransferase